MEFNKYIHFKDMENPEILNRLISRKENAILIQVCPFNQIYGLYYISPRYRSSVIKKFLEQPIYTSELKEFLKQCKHEITTEMRLYYNYITDEKLHIMYYKDVIQIDKLKNFKPTVYKLNDIEIIHF